MKNPQKRILRVVVEKVAGMIFIKIVRFIEKSLN